MNIFLELENDLSKDQINSITIYSCSSKARYKKLMDCFFDANHRIVLRASWIVIQSLDYKRSMLDPYIKDLVAAISHQNMAEHLVRNSLRILELIDISEQYHGELMNACFGFIESPDTPIAIKAYSLTIVYKLSIIYPEIQDEIKCIIKANWDNETPAFKSRGKKILSLINKSRRMK